jgi:hypothetical protein
MRQQFKDRLVPQGTMQVESRRNKANYSTRERPVAMNAKKLKLSRETLRSLTTDQMGTIGGQGSVATCGTCPVCTGAACGPTAAPSGCTCGVTNSCASYCGGCGGPSAACSPSYQYLCAP